MFKCLRVSEEKVRKLSDSGDQLGLSFLRCQRFHPDIRKIELRIDLLVFTRDKKCPGGIMV